MLRSTVLGAALLVAACSAPRHEPSPPSGNATAGQATSSQVAPTPAAGPSPAPDSSPIPEIVIDSVSATNPLVVRGHARTFENALSLRLRDSRGGVIREVHTMSSGESGHHNLFEAQLWVTRDPGASITVEAFEYSAKDGSVRSLTSASIAYPVERIRATLMFPAGDCTDIRPFVRTLPKSISLARLLTEALIAGPTAEEKSAGASEPFPDGSAVNSIRLKDNVLTIDFNDRLRNVGGSCATTAIRESVTRTMMKLPNVRRVVITAAGSEPLALQP